MEDANPYEATDSVAVTKDSDGGVLPHAIALMGKIALLSVVAMVPIVFFQSIFPPWLIIVALIGFFVPMGINIVLLLALLARTVFGDVKNKVQQAAFVRTPPWESPRRIDEHHDSLWYSKLLDRLRHIHDVEGMKIPTGATLWKDKETEQHWLCVMGSKGFATFDLFIPTTLEELQPAKNPFADRT